MLVECRTCGAEIDAPINSDLGAAQCGACRQDGADNMGAILTPEQMVDAHRIQAEMDRQDRLSTLSARVVEAAVERKRRRDAWMVCREPGDGSSPKYVAYTEAIGELDAAIDALIAERQR